MAQYMNNDLDYIVEDGFEMLQFDDEVLMNRQEESDQIPNYESSKEKNDISENDYRNGKDMQGIPWERLNYSREEYREMRLKQYKNYENLPGRRIEFEEESKIKNVESASTFYDFHFNTRLVKPTIVHFQHLFRRWDHFISIDDKLRNLLWATTKHDVYFMQNYSIMHWSSLQHCRKEVLNVSGKIIPTEKHHESSSQPVSRVQISTMTVNQNLVVVGGFNGELLCKQLGHVGVDFSTKLTNNDTSITNAVDICHSLSGSVQIMVANNDCCLRIFDIEKFFLLNRLSFPWSVNSTATRPDGKQIAVLGDSTECLIVDLQSGKLITSLEGHTDYSFASAWHPDGIILATGNQDKTCRLWDVRNLSKSLAVLSGKIGAIRGIKFSLDGQFMAMAEPADFVHLYDTKANYRTAQEIDLFGEIAGMSFSPDTEALFVGVADRTYGSLLEFNRRRQYRYLLDYFS